MDLSNYLKPVYSSNEILAFYRRDKSMGREYNLIVDKIIKNYLQVDNYKIISEYKDKAEIYIDLYKYSITDYTEFDYHIFNSVINVEEIRIKDRLFREEITYYKAYELIASCTKFMIELFKNNQFKVIFGQCIDNYVIDIAARVGSYFGIPYIGVVKFFYTGYVRLTAYGEYNYVREPNKNEIESLFQKLVLKEKTIFAPEKKEVVLNNIKYFFIFKAKYLFHYIILNKILNKKEYDYLIKSSVYPKSLHMFYLADKAYISRLPPKQTNIEYIYIPLHYYPEATIEYWANDINISSYYPNLIKVLTVLAKRGYHLLVKEHPAMYQKRAYSIIQNLKKINNLYLLSPFISTNEIYEMTDKIVVWTGTSGIEAYMTDKIVVAICNTYYSDGFYKIEDLLSEDKILLPASSQDKLRLAKHILSNCLPI